MTEPTPQAYSYVRFSSPEQAKGDSLRRQLEKARAYAEKNGLTLIEDFRDLGKSAFRGANRTTGALGAFLAAVQEGRVPRGSVLIVENLDRLSREEVVDAFDQFRAIIRSGIEIVTLGDNEQRYNETIIRTDVTKLLVSLLVMLRAHEESKNKSDRVGAVWKQKRLRAETTGEPMTARCPAWLRTVGHDRQRRFEAIPERAAVIISIFNETIDGIGKAVLARRLNRRGVPSWGPNAKGWQPSYVDKILDSRAVLGYYQPHQRVEGVRKSIGAELAGYYPVIIDEGLWWRARAARDKRRTAGGAKGKDGRLSNLFTGIAKCASCGGPMVHVDKGRRPKGGRYLVCDSLRRGMACATPAGSWRYDKVEAIVLRRITRLDLAVLKGDDRAAADLAAEVTAVRAKLDAMERRRNQLLTLTDLDDRDILAAIRQATLDARTLAGSLKALEDDVAKAMHELSPENRLAQIEDLTKRMNESTGPDAYRIRASLAQAIRQTLRVLKFQPDNIIAYYVKEMPIRNRLQKPDSMGFVLFPNVAELEADLAIELAAAQDQPLDGGYARIQGRISPMRTIESDEERLDFLQQMPPQ